MTSRIYYTEPACRTFDARVTRSFTHDGRPAVILDRTAFYPTSGGQPFDTGTLWDNPSGLSDPGAQRHGIAVVETLDVDDEVVHVLASAIAAGAAVHGEVAWARRFDHMQQHTGQHVLSAVCERLSGNATVSVHMGADTSTIDLARDVTAEDVARAEDEANRVVWDDLEVAIRFVSAAEAAALPLRKDSTRDGTLRLIEIGDVDLSACGGTHVATTGAIGSIAVTGWERFKGGSRVTFVCGGRALRSFRALRHAVAGSVRLLSVLPAELPDAIERLQDEAREHRRTVKRLQAALATHEAAALLDGATTLGGVRIVVRSVDGWDAAGLKSLASGAVAGAVANGGARGVAGGGVAAGGGVIVALLTATSPVQIVIARSPGVNADAGAMLRQLVERFGGKGGGGPELAQGGGLAGDIREITWAVSGLIEDALTRT